MLFLFLEFDDERLAGAGGLRTICNGYRRSGIAWTAFDVVRNVAGVTEELNFVRLRGMKFHVAAVGPNAKCQAVGAVQIYKKTRDFFPLNTRADWRKCFEDRFR